MSLLSYPGGKGMSVYVDNARIPFWRIKMYLLGLVNIHI